MGTVYIFLADLSKKHNGKTLGHSLGTLSSGRWVILSSLEDYFCSQIHKDLCCVGDLHLRTKA